MVREYVSCVFILCQFRTDFQTFVPSCYYLLRYNCTCLYIPKVHVTVLHCQV